jgi:hypothetical protein
MYSEVTVWVAPFDLFGVPLYCMTPTTRMQAG